MKFFLLVFIIILFSFSNSKSQWESANQGLEELFDPFLSVYKIIGVNDKLYALSDNAGYVLFSSNFGNLWDIINTRSDNHWPHWCSNCLIASGDTIYYGISNPMPKNIIFRSSDSFTSWEVINFSTIIPLSVVEILNNSIYIGTEEYGIIAKSPDLGENWYVKSAKLNPYNEDADIIDIHIFGSRIFVGLNNPYFPEYNGVYYSDDDMESFIKAEINSENRNSIRFLDHQGILYALADNESFMSSDSGATWQSMKNSFGKFTPKTLQIAFHDSIIIASNFEEAKVIISTDNGNTWQKKDEGLSYSPRFLTIFDDYVFAGVEGIQRARLDELTAVDDSKPLTNSIRINPNPIEEQSNIIFNLDSPGNIKLIVFDHLGRQIEEIYNGFKDAGQHSISFDSGRLSAGVYFCTLFVGGSIETEKMVIMK